MWRQMACALAWTAVLGFLAGCGPARVTGEDTDGPVVVRLYEGGERPSSEISAISIALSDSKPLAIDGRRIPSNADTVLLRPGKHSADLEVRTWGMADGEIVEQVRPFELTFSLAAGSLYKFTVTTRLIQPEGIFLAEPTLLKLAIDLWEGEARLAPP
ncbi:MAG: hypothetical protein QNJ30_19400 [Kiloniellales bacterium]|nr:hypothetical protein [Kiloniellales bacterium]